MRWRKRPKDRAASRADGQEDEIRYGRNHDELRYFVSSRMNGTLDDERKVAADTIDRLDTHRAWWWERDALAGVLHSERECVRYAATSDGIVLLVAGHLSDIVYAEYAAAKNASAQRYILIRQGDELPPEVRAFIDSEQTSAVTRNFQNTTELQSHLYQALVRSTVRASREEQIGRRRTGAGERV